MQISALFRQFCVKEPVFVIIDVRPGVIGIPTAAYMAVEEVAGEGKEIQRVFQHISCAVEADEAEEVSMTLELGKLQIIFDCRWEWSICCETSMTHPPALWPFIFNRKSME